MAIITIHEAKTKLSELIRRVEAGEEIIIARGNKPVAVLKEFIDKDIAARRRAGMNSLAGKVPPIPDSVFFDPLPEEELALWYNSKIDP